MSPSDTVLQALSDTGLLLVQDKQLPNIATLVTGETLRGSWWSHPKGRLIFAVMAFGAAGDVLLGAAGFVVGGAAFLVGHLIAIVLYQRNRRAGLGWPAWIAAAALIAATVAAAYLLPADRAGAPGVALYAFGLAYMAASAWLSRFPRTVAVGATMFLVSDLLIFARSGPLAGQPGLGFAIWSLYFAGEALIATGVVRTLAREGH